MLFTGTDIVGLPTLIKVSFKARWKILSGNVLLKNFWIKDK
jgi:hypothetical protein